MELILKTLENGICTLTINRPDQYNALNKDVLIELAPERFGGLIDNFGHTQVYDGSKLRTLMPEFQPIFSCLYPPKSAFRIISHSDAWTKDNSCCNVALQSRIMIVPTLI